MAGDILLQLGNAAGGIQHPETWVLGRTLQIGIAHALMEISLFLLETVQLAAAGHALAGHIQRYIKQQGQIGLQACCTQFSSTAMRSAGTPRPPP